MADEPNYIIKWNEKSHRWFIRGIRSDGHLYGEIMLRTPQPKQMDFEAQLAPWEYEKVRGIVSEISQFGQEPSDAPWKGLLATGPLDNARVVFQFRQPDDQNAPSRLFVEIIELLRPHIASIATRV